MFLFLFIYYFLFNSDFFRVDYSNTIYSVDFINFLSKILEKDYNKRLCTNQIINDPFLKNI